MNKSQEALNLIVLLKHADMPCLVALCTEVYVPLKNKASVATAFSHSCAVHL